MPRLREWLVIPLERLDPPVSTPLAAAWLGGLGLLLLLAVGFSWHITRPLTRLADAADRLAAGQPQRVDPAGPTETRRERFNAMLDALAESDSVRRTLLAGLPHDLKGPLSRMWLRIELADDSKLKDGLRADLQDMQHMVDQFIGFVRGTDPAAYRYASMALQDWLGERVRAWQGAGTDIRLHGAEDPALVVQADAVALGRLLDNLIGNALNHGAPPVDVTLHQEGRHAVLDVADHGPGIAPERRREALRPFSRLDDARTRTGSVGRGWRWPRPSPAPTAARWNCCRPRRAACACACCPCRTPPNGLACGRRARPGHLRYDARCIVPSRFRTMAIQSDSLSSRPDAARIVAPQPASPNEESIERALRPKALQEYVGQQRAREQLEIFIAARASAARR